MGLKNYSLALLTDSFVDEGVRQGGCRWGGYDVRGRAPPCKTKGRAL